MLHSESWAINPTKELRWCRPNDQNLGGRCLNCGYHVADNLLPSPADYPHLPVHLFRPYQNPPTVIYSMTLRSDWLKAHGIKPSFENCFFGDAGVIPSDILDSIMAEAKVLADVYFQLR